MGFSVLIGVAVNMDRKSNRGAASDERKWGQMYNSMYLFSDQSGI